MEFRNLALIFYFLILIDSAKNIFGMKIPKFSKKKYNIENIKENSPRYLQEQNTFDSYMILYFTDNCNYPKGFKNEYRNGIFLRQNGYNLSIEDELSINKGFGIEIHFNSNITNLNNFFSSSSDDNMNFLMSVDLSNFDSSLVKDTSSMFFECISLESINFLNINTSSLTSMDSMF